MVHSNDLRAGFASRLKKALTASDIPEWGAGARLAKIAGVTAKAASKWLNGESIPGSANLLKIAEALGVRREWLEYGEGSEKSQIGELLVPVSVWDDNTPLDDDEVELPFYEEVELSGGPGTTVVLQTAGARLRFDKGVLRKKHIHADKAGCARVKGNSMEPILPDGTVVGIDANHTSIKDGDMYAIDHSGQLRVKQLYRLPGGGLRVRSFNSDEHPDERYEATEVAEQIHVIGRVFWYSVLC